MNSNFEKAVNVVLFRKCTYRNIPSDPWRPTNFGISQKSSPNLDIMTRTKKAAVALYRRHCP